MHPAPTALAGKIRCVAKVGLWFLLRMPSTSLIVAAVAAAAAATALATPTCALQVPLLHTNYVRSTIPVYRLHPYPCTFQLSSRAHETSDSSAIYASSRGNDQSRRRYSNLPRLFTGLLTLNNVEPIASSSETLAKGMKVRLSPDQSHYLSKVLRFRKGRPIPEKSIDSDATVIADMKHCVRIFDGKNGEWLARVAAVEEEQGQQRRGRNRGAVTPSLFAECLLQLRQQEIDLVELAPSPWIFFSPIKKHRAKLLVEKCCELGGGLFVPIISSRTENNSISACIGDVRDGIQTTDGLDKLSLQALEASEQCERLSVPRVALIPGLAKSNEQSQDLWNVEVLLNSWSDESVSLKRTLLICRERTSGNDILSKLRDIYCTTNTKGVAFLIGPEGGWSPDENVLFDEYQAKDPNIQSISLGALVLRAETAAITCVAAWNLHQASAEKI